MAELEELALRAGPAIENARRFREARQLADLDALTGLHNRRYFHETLAREVARAHRYDRKLALIIFDLDDFKAINDRIGHLSGDGVLAEAAERIRDVVRSADIACRVGGDEFAVILPESTARGRGPALRAAPDGARRRSPVGQAGPLTMSAGVAELQPDDDAIAFFQRADHALYGAKEAGKGQVVAASLHAAGSRRRTCRRDLPRPPPEEPPTTSNDSGLGPHETSRALNVGRSHSVFASVPSGAMVATPARTQVRKPGTTHVGTTSARSVRRPMGRRWVKERVFVGQPGNRLLFSCREIEDEHLVGGTMT